MRAAEALIADAPGGTWSVRDLTVRIYDLHTDPTEPQLRTGGVVGAPRSGHGDRPHLRPQDLPGRGREDLPRRPLTLCVEGPGSVQSERSPYVIALPEAPPRSTCVST